MWKKLGRVSHQLCKKPTAPKKNNTATRSVTWRFPFEGPFVEKNSIRWISSDANQPDSDKNHDL